MSKKPAETVVETTHTATVEAVVEDTSTELGASAWVTYDVLVTLAGSSRIRR